MKIKDGFKLRTVAGQSIIVAEGTQQANFNKLVSLNSSAALLWQAAEGHDFTVEDMAKTLVDHYGIEQDQALADAAEITARWVETGLAEA